MQPQGTGQPILDSNGQISNIDMSTLNGAGSAVSAAGLDLNTVITSLQNEVGNISSSETSIDNAVGSAIQSQRDAATANQQRINSQYTRESGYLAGKLANERTSMLEQSRGGAISGSALLLVDKEIDKNLKDLDMRKEELILQGNALAADNISKLQMQQLTLKLDLQQKRFDNLLGVGGLQNTIIQTQNEEKQRSRQMTLDQLKFNLEERQQDALEFNSERDYINETARINILKSELGIKQLAEARAQKDKVKEDRLDTLATQSGFPNAAAQIQITQYVNSEMSRLDLDSLSGNELRAAQAMIITTALNTYPGLQIRAIESLVLGEAKAKYIEQQLYEESLRDGEQSTVTGKSAYDIDFSNIGGIYGIKPTGTTTTPKPFMDSSFYGLNTSNSSKSFIPPTTKKQSSGGFSLNN